MTWFDRRLCTLEEAQRKLPAENRAPGLLQIGDEARLWHSAPGQPDAYLGVDCYVVGVKVGFDSKFFYDVALPIEGSELCAVLQGLYACVTPRSVTQFDIAKHGALEVTELMPKIRRELMRPVSSEPEAEPAGTRVDALDTETGQALVHQPHLQRTIEHPDGSVTVDYGNRVIPLFNPR